MRGITSRGQGPERSGQSAQRWAGWVRHLGLARKERVALVEVLVAAPDVKQQHALAGGLCGRRLLRAKQSAGGCCVDTSTTEPNPTPPNSAPRREKPLQSPPACSRRTVKKAGRMELRAWNRLALEPAREHAAAAAGRLRRVHPRPRRCLMLAGVRRAGDALMRSLEPNAG